MGKESRRFRNDFLKRLCAGIMGKAGFGDGEIKGRPKQRF